MVSLVKIEPYPEPFKTLAAPIIHPRAVQTPNLRPQVSGTRQNSPVRNSQTPHRESPVQSSTNQAIMRKTFMIPLRQASLVWRISGGGTGPARVVNPEIQQAPSLRPISNCAVRRSHSNASNANNNNAATSPLGHVGVAAALAAEGAGVK